jgi:uncharacterized protein YbjT (DUF2867 family)
MKDKKVILVTGATGAQGGSVARSLLGKGKYSVRCMTRNIHSDKAQALRESGAELVHGDMDNIESLKNAMKGCYGVFGVTSFWEHFEKEFQQGKNLIDAVAETNIKHFVFSTLPHAKKLSDGKLEVPHLDQKGKLEEYTRGLDIEATFIHVAFYYENFLYFFPPKKNGNGSYAFGFPQGDTLLAGISVEDLGGIVASVFDSPEEFKGRVVGAVGDDLRPDEYAEVMTRVLGKTVEYNHIDREVFASFGFPGADDLANMFEFNRYYIPNRENDREESKSLNPGIKTFEVWLLENKEQFMNVLES